MSPRPAVDLPDLEPARWIWYPSERTLPNTFLLFRRELDLSEAPVSARGWISAESRYLLAANGTRVQWGPAPCDPRWPEADPFDLAPLLRPGKNVLAVTVLYFGHGDGTWPVGKPGFLLRLECVFADGRREIVVSDERWQIHLSRAWPPGQYKRWYLRALQEEFDSRLHPHGWTTAVFQPTPDWLAAMPLRGSPNRPALAASGQDYTQNLGEGPADCSLRPRRIPLLREYEAPAPRLSGSFRLAWRRPPREYFEMYPPDAFSVAGGPAAQDDGNGGWSIELDGVHGVVLTFEFAEQGVGWPHFEIDAPAGTTVELLVHEAHAPDGPPLLSGVFHAWSRFICRGGRERFEPFDFESLRWLQLHVHGTAGAVQVATVGLRRRVFPWPHEPVACVREPALQRLIAATLNTLNNCAQETLVDGMARERQQYSGDCGHQIHALHLAFGETRLTSRFLSTFSQGLTKDGYFLDCWPAYDRLARLAQRQLDLTVWGPILDHSVGFVFDCWHTYAHTGDLDAVAEAYPRLLRFCAHLAGRIGSDGLLPVEDLGVPSVWIDHDAYLQQQHKQCAFTLYSAAMLRDALAPLARAFGDGGRAAEAERVADRLIKGAVAAFWSPEDRLFVVNRPWLAEEGGNARLCDRSLATALLHDLIPADGRATAVDALVSLPPHALGDNGLGQPEHDPLRSVAGAPRLRRSVEPLPGRAALHSSPGPPGLPSARAGVPPGGAASAARGPRVPRARHAHAVGPHSVRGGRPPGTTTRRSQPTRGLRRRAAAARRVPVHSRSRERTLPRRPAPLPPARGRISPPPPSLVS
jgi:alpha-L-rhamnosidase